MSQDICSYIIDPIILNCVVSATKVYLLMGAQLAATVS